MLPKRIAKNKSKVFRIEKVIQRKGDELYVKQKGYNSSINNWIHKKDIMQMSEYFAEPRSSGRRVKAELDLSNNATKADLKNVTDVDTPKFVKKVDLASLKSEANILDIAKLEKLPTGLNSLKSKLDKLNVDKLVPAPVHLSKLSDAVKNYVVNKDVYNAKIKNIKDIIPGITNLGTNTTLNSKTNEVKSEIPDITNIATN